MLSPLNDGLDPELSLCGWIACEGEGGFDFLTHLDPFPCAEA